MKTIPSSVPVFIQNLESKNGKYSKAKLKVFYIGETADHRLFSEQFAEEVVKTLPLTPVVGYYDEDDDDFIGHNKVQYVYGLIPESAETTFETDENGTQWLVTDVLLYTERKDNIGDVAKKIVGKQHSLELNPDTLKYKINRDKFGKFLNVEFQSGEFIGLSVLGDKEQPAFTGSGFFTTTDADSFALECHQNFDRFLTFLNNDGGKIEVMEFSLTHFLEKVAEAAKITMQDFQEKIYRWMEENEVFGYLVENTEDYAIICNCGEQKLYRYDIAVEGDVITLHDPKEVVVQYVVKEEIQQPQPKEEIQQPQPKEEVFAEQPKKEEQPQEEVQPEQPEQPKEEQFEQPEQPEEEEQPKPEPQNEENREGDLSAKQEEIKEEPEQVDEPIETNNPSPLTDRERLELEDYRREAKIRAIREYEEDVDKETIQHYINNVDQYSIEQLQNELNKVFRQQAKAKAKSVTDNSMAVTAFNIISQDRTYNENDPADVINRYKNK